MKKRFTDEQIIRNLREAENRDEPVKDRCKRHNISEQTFYRWRNKLTRRGLSQRGQVRPARYRATNARHQRPSRCVPSRACRVQSRRHRMATCARRAASATLSMQDIQSDRNDWMPHLRDPTDFHGTHRIVAQALAAERGHGVSRHRLSDRAVRYRFPGDDIA
ncbi:transposase [Burkholderia ambifaria]|uniref:transposase n=1 Tax=Burkholderia ambifaria TaxID=152480 RepID=UPI001E528166|nr:transposase [Burkholderia ambifaria]